MTGPKILIAASGSGGHLFPALYIARALASKAPSAEIQFIGSGRPLEGKIVDSNGYKRHVISVSGVQSGGVKSLLSFLTKAPKAILSLRRLYKEFQPNVVIGVGGYVSVLPVIYARFSRIPTWIHEGELNPGLANWLLSFFTSKMSTGFMEAKVPCWAKKKTVFSGHPLRAELLALAKCPPKETTPQNLLIIGGSQGAKALDLALPKLSQQLSKHKLSILHQSRKENVESVSTSYKEAAVNANVVGFIDDMAKAYEWADIIISRSGAGSVLEISVVGKPAIFVPYPYQQGSHQTENAMTLVNAGKALIVEEGGNFTERLGEALDKILSLGTYQAMSQIKYAGRALDGANIIAEGVISLTKVAKSLS